MGRQNEYQQKLGGEGTPRCALAQYLWSQYKLVSSCQLRATSNGDQSALWAHVVWEGLCLYRLPCASRNFDLAHTTRTRFYIDSKDSYY